MQVRQVKQKKQKIKKEFKMPDVKTRYRQEKDNLSNGKFRLYAFLISCIIFSILSVAQYCKVVTTNFEISQAESQIEILLEEQRELEMSIAELTSLVRIENIARNELAMEEAGDMGIMTASRD